MLRSLVGSEMCIRDRPIGLVVKLSRGRSGGRCVGLSSALWKNGRSDPDAIWHHRSDGSKDEADSGISGSVHGKGYFWGEFGARHCNQWGLYRVGVRECLNRRSCGLGWCVRWAEALLYCIGVHVVRKGRFGDFCSPFSQREMPLVADGVMFPIRMRKFDNFSVPQTYLWKARFVGFLAIYSVSRSKLGFMRN